MQSKYLGNNEEIIQIIPRREAPKDTQSASQKIRSFATSASDIALAVAFSPIVIGGYIAQGAILGVFSGMLLADELLSNVGAAFNKASAAFRPIKDVNEVNEHYQHETVLSAIRRHDYTLLERLLDAGYTPDSANDQGHTALMTAALLGDKKSISLLLEHGAKIDAVDNKGRTALFLAVEKKNSAAVDTLLNLGANPKAGNIRAYSSLHQATSDGAVKIVASLIAAGADLNSRSGNRRETALALTKEASFYNPQESMEIAKMLVQAGADTSAILDRTYIGVSTSPDRAEWIKEFKNLLEGKEEGLAIQNAGFKQNAPQPKR